MNSMALIERYGQTLSLIRREITQAIDVETGDLTDTVTESTPWTGRGSLQASRGRNNRAVAGTVGGVEEALVPYKAYLPWDAHPRHGWVLRDEVGREYEMVTAPLNPGGTRAYWLLNLGNPTNAPEWAYISTGLWVTL